MFSLYDSHAGMFREGIGAYDRGLVPASWLRRRPWPLQFYPSTTPTLEGKFREGIGGYNKRQS